MSTIPATPDACQCPAIPVACQWPDIPKACQRPVAREVCQWPAVPKACQRPAIHEACQRPLTPRPVSVQWAPKVQYSISFFSENLKFLKIVFKKSKYLGKKRFVSGYGGT